MQKAKRSENNWKEGGKAEWDSYCMFDFFKFEHINLIQSLINVLMFNCFFFSFLFKILDEEITPTMQKLQEVRSLQIKLLHRHDSNK